MNNIGLEMESTRPASGVSMKVIGVGGGGNNAVDRMIEAGVTDAEFISINTDLQQLKTVKSPTTVQIGAKLTAGLGAGAMPEVGKKAAEETENEIKEILKGTDMVFITAGMGGGTGTGAAPVIAKLAKDMGILTVAVITKPFFFEGPQRMRNAEAGIEELSQCVDSIVTIPNDLLLKTADKKININDSFKFADEVLRQGVVGIIELISRKGLMNLDFADVCTVMRDSGITHMGIGVGKGENAAQDAVRSAIENPLVETNISGAAKAIINIIGGTELSLVDMGEVSGIVREMVAQDATIIVGTATDESMATDEIKVTLVATGLDINTKKSSSTYGSNVFQSPSQRPVSSPFGSDVKMPTYNTQKSDDNMFSRKVSPSLDNVNVPSFLRPKNN